MKNYLIVLLSVLMSLMSIKAYAYMFEKDGIYYNINSWEEKTASVTYASLPYGWDIIIPSIVPYANTNFSVTSIGNRAFANCDGLTSVSIPNTVTSIDDFAFAGCERLTSITIPNSVTSIGNYAFYGCNGISFVVIPNNVTSIGEYAFSRCNGLTSVMIGKSVITVGKCAFEGCEELTTIKVEEGNTHYDSREDCNAIVETSSNKLIKGCKNTIIPCDVTSVGEVAFQKCKGLTSVTIPNSVISIEKGAFEDCNELTSVTIGNSVSSIGESAFLKCRGLTSVTIPNSVISIGKNAFYDCDELTSVTIGSSVSSIGEYVFQGCDKLKTVISLNNDPPVIEAFTFDKTAQTNVTIEVPVDCGCKYAKADEWKNFDIIYSVTNDNKKLYPVPINVNGKSIVSVNGVKKDGLEIEEGKNIKIVALNGLELSETVYQDGMDVSNDVRQHGLYSFTPSRNHRKNVIETFVYSPLVVQQPKSGTLLEQVGVGNIDGIQNLKIIGDVNGTDMLVMRKMSNLLYLDMSEANIVDGGQSYYENYITSKNEIGDYFFVDLGKLTKVILPNKVTVIGSYAFGGCGNLKSVTIPNGVTLIGRGAFMNCRDLTSVTIPNNVTTIGSNAFSGCSKLLSAVIPNSVTSVGDNTFDSCVKLTSITISQNVTSIESGTFYGCRALTSLVIPNSVKSIKFSAFAGCSDLISIKLPNSITSIELGVFEGCSRLASVTIPDNVTLIRDRAFAGCKGLTFITIPSNVTYIGYNAFGGCTGLKEVISLNTIPPKITDSTFEEETQKEAILNVPSESKTIYWLTPVWENFLNMGEGIGKITYTLTYIIDGDVYKSYQLQEGLAIIPEEAPIKEGFTFSGWSLVPKTMPAKDVTITGSFIINKYKLVYKVDDEEYKTVELEFGTNITSEAEPTKEGYTFSGWSGIPETMPANDVTITGSFTIVDENQDIKVDDDGRWTKYVVTSGTAGVVSHEDYPNLFDNDTNTKWCVTDVSGTIYVEFDATQSIKPIGYVLTTAVDTYPYCLDRNPKSWMIKGRNSTSGEWTTLTTVANVVMPTGNCTSTTFMLNTNSTYRYYRFEVTSLVGGDIFQLSEFCFLVGENPDDIKDIKAGDGSYDIYTLDGKPVETMQKGLNIIRHSNGTTQKIYVK